MRQSVTSSISSIFSRQEKSENSMHTGKQTEDETSDASMSSETVLQDKKNLGKKQEWNKVEQKIGE